MYALKNKVQLIGNLADRPESRETLSGRRLALFSIITSESYRNTKGEKVTELQWHRLIAWGRLAEIVIKHLDKGREVAIEGKLVNRDYIDKEGTRRYVTEVRVNELLILGTRTIEDVDLSG